MSTQLLQLADIEDKKETAIQKRTVWDLIYSSSSKDSDDTTDTLPSDEEAEIEDVDNDLTYNKYIEQNDYTYSNIQNLKIIMFMNITF